MIYIISDIHGCKKEYLELLRKIKFSDEDYLYILGDVLDRGEDPIGVLRDIMNRKNVTLIMGNHEYLFYSFVKTLGLDFSNFKSEDEKWDFRAWVRDGGLPTFEGYLNLTQDEKKSIYNYIESRKAYATLEYKRKKYILVHAGIANFDETKALDQYDLSDFICKRADYSRRYYTDENISLVTGHTPTIAFQSGRTPRVFIRNGHIAIDCGCIYGGKLAAYCIETGKTEYVEGVTRA